MLTTRTFLVRGLLAGFIAGVLTFGVAYLVGESSINSAIAFEDGRPSAGSAMTGGMTRGIVQMSRTDQSTWGLLTGTTVYGLALGGILALATAFALGRLGTRTAQGTAATCAALGLTAVYVVPFVKYPPSPPSVGQAATIGTRTALYFGFLALSVITTVVAVMLARRWTPSHGPFTAGLLAAGGYLAVVILAALSFPGVNEIPAGFPAGVLWTFRMSSLGTQAFLWAALGVLLGLLLKKPVARSMSTVGPARPAGPLVPGGSA